MSFQAMAWAVKQPLPSREKFLLIILANYANDRDQCWPAIGTLCRDTGYSRMTVSRGLAKLVELGALKATARSKGGMKTSKMYRIMVKQELQAFVDDDE
jgi:pyocin large subunit-like protein